MPGPLNFVGISLGIALVLVASGSVVRAHDPGLSVLDVTANGITISVTLSISATDVEQLVASSGLDEQRAVGDVVRGAIQVSVGDERLPLNNERVEIGSDGARIHWSHDAPPSSAMRRLSVSSFVPGRFARGHRELVVITAAGRVVTERIVDATTNSVAVDLVVAQPSILEKAWSFLTLGVRHILSGYDHLAFLAGLILAAVTLRELAIALTAFTVAHSLSLALVVVGGVHLSPSIVEPLIAASIAWIGIENLLRRGDRHRARWWLVFAFGLIHGFGFAGGLMELGFGTTAREIAVALLSFNGGVEIGQLVVALALLPVVRLMQSRPVWRARLVPLCSSLIVVAGGYWLVERLW
jgi:hydrogenase/urease accessory protein HupE